MAKIPFLNSDTRVSTDVPRTQSRFETAGLEGRGLQELGKGLKDLGAGVGKGLRNLEIAREKAQISEFGDNTSRQYRLEVDAFVKSTRAKMSGTNHDGYSKEVEEFLTTKRDELAAGTDNQKARDYFLKKTDGFYTSRLMDSSSYENSARSRFNVGNRDKTIDETSKYLYDAPDPFRATNELLIMRNELDAQKGLQFTNEQAEGLKNKAGVKFRESVLLGMVRDGLPGVITEDMPRAQKEASIKSFLNGEQEGTAELFQGMGPEEKIRYESKMMALVDRQEEVRDQETGIMARNAADILVSGERLSASQQGEVNAIFSRISAMEQGPKRDIMLRDLVNARKVGNIVDQARVMSKSQIAQIDMDEVFGKSGMITAGSDMSAKTQLAQGLSKMLAERDRDGKAYINANFPDVAENPLKAHQLQKALGIKEPRFMTKDESRAESMAIMENLTPMDKAAALDIFLAKRGDSGFQAVSEMIKDNPDFDKSYLFASYFNSTLSKESIISNASRKTTINTEYDAAHPTQSAMLKKKIQDEMSIPMSIFNRSQLSDFSGALREAVELDVKDRILRNPNLTHEDAIQSSIKKIVGDNFDFVSEEKASLIVPRELGVSKRSLDAYLDGSLSDEAIQEYGITSSRYSFSGSQQEFNDQIRKNAHWASNEAQDGMVLMYTNPRTGITAVLSDNNGSKVEVKYKGIPQHQRTLDNLNSFFGHGTRDYFKKTPLGQSLNQGAKK